MLELDELESIELELLESIELEELESIELEELDSSTLIVTVVHLLNPTTSESF